MRLIPFGAFQAMLGILFAMTIVLALLATADMIASEKNFQGSSTMLAILLLGAEGRNCHVVERFFQRRRREKNEMDRLSPLSCPSVSFDCPQREEERERGQVYISGREEKTKECGLLSGPLFDSPFGRLRHQTTIGRGTGE